jgi:hypothetical protein
VKRPDTETIVEQITKIRPPIWFLFLLFKAKLARHKVGVTVIYLSSSTGASDWSPNFQLFFKYFKNVYATLFYQIVVKQPVI